MIEPIARIRIELQEIERKIWRRVDVPLSSTLLALPDFTQFALRWTDSHLFEFEIGDRRYGQPEYDRYPDESLDYVVVHELVHLRAWGHDRDYWQAVERAMPDYERRREQLRECGGGLGW